MVPSMMIMVMMMMMVLIMMVMMIGLFPSMDAARIVITREGRCSIVDT
jgi:hypothetical protein